MNSLIFITPVALTLFSFLASIITLSKCGFKDQEACIVTSVIVMVVTALTTLVSYNIIH